jgi:hypothetical protein
VEIVSTSPVGTKEAIYALDRILRERGVFGKMFMFKPYYTPRFHIHSWLKSFTRVAGKTKGEVDE